MKAMKAPAKPAGRTTREEQKKNVVDVLNQARSMELHGIHQYMNQHYNLDNLDYGELVICSTT